MGEVGRYVWANKNGVVGIRGTDDSFIVPSEALNQLADDGVFDEMNRQCDLLLDAYESEDIPVAKLPEVVAILQAYIGDQESDGEPTNLAVALAVDAAEEWIRLANRAVRLNHPLVASL